MKKSLLLTVLTLLCVLLTAQVAMALSGAIFTTVKDGTVVNGNTKYQAKEDVYLDGGPGPRAPVGAAALPEGDYYFQVTDPSGKKKLSMDPIESRKISVNSSGVIDYIFPAPTTTKYQGKTYGTHLQGIDQDHADDGAITVQLMPYDDTPNPGGVYKVWITRVEDYGKPNEGCFGFIPSKSKTDNYKVKGRLIPPVITVKKFHDLNGDGVWQSTEPTMAWWVDVEEPSGAPGGEWTTFDYLAGDSGVYSFTEKFPAHTPPWRQTALIIDGVPQKVSQTATVAVLGSSEETHEIIFGNAVTPKVTVKKFHDLDGDGKWDTGEPELNWKIDIGLPDKTADWDLTPFTYIPSQEGTHSFTEEMPANTPPWRQTALIIDGVAQKVSQTALLKILGTSEESHTIIFGNAVTPEITVKKFLDKNRDGEKQTDEPWLNWKVEYLRPDDSTGASETPFSILAAQKGTYWFKEQIPKATPPWEQTALYVDDVKKAVSVNATVGVSGASGETHTVIYGNAVVPNIVVKKFLDKNRDGVKQDTEPWLVWRVEWKTPSKQTGSEDTPYELLAREKGDYAFTEKIPADGQVWEQTALYIDDKAQPISKTATVTVAGSSSETHTVIFGNAVCPQVTVKKFHDVDADGEKDSDEEWLEWDVKITNPDLSTLTKKTTFDYQTLKAGKYSFTETSPSVTPAWKQTALYIDGVKQSVSPTADVNVVGSSGETHTVIFGNVRAICIPAEKFYDADGDGERDACEGPVPGIKFELYRVNTDGSQTLLDTQVADKDGKYTWCGYLAGTYLVKEILPSPQWVETTSTLVPKYIPEGTSGKFVFGNYYTSWASFFTKGYWHNKNGLAELTTDDRDAVNKLAPYSSPSSYFSTGDEPFDGKFTNGDPVAPAFDGESLIWAGGTWQSEISLFLVNNNGNGTPREQLAQQLLAFIFNVRHTVTGCTIIDNGKVYSTDKLIADAIEAWKSGTDAERTSIKSVLDYFNNKGAGAVCVIWPTPPEVEY